MSKGAYGLRCPEIFHPGGISPHANTVTINTSISDSHVKGIGVKSWVKRATNSVITVAGSTENPAFRVIAIRDPQNRWLNLQFVTAAQLLANVYQLVVEPVGNLIYMGTEDADTTPITDANSGSGGSSTLHYANFAAPTDPTTQDGNINPYQSPPQLLLIDSSTHTTSAGSTAIQLLGPVPNFGSRIYSATSLASPRTFLFKVRAATDSQ